MRRGQLPIPFQCPNFGGLSVGETVNQESLAKGQQVVSAAIETLRTEIIAVKRRTAVLTDGVQHEFKMVATGFQMHLNRRHTDDRAYLDEQFRETRALIQLSYGQIQERVERLEQRVRSIEQHLGFTA
jgi:hypothetical protein